MAQTLRPRPTACRPPPLQRKAPARTGVHSARESLYLERHTSEWPGQAGIDTAMRGHHGRPASGEGGGGKPNDSPGRRRGVKAQGPDPTADTPGGTDKPRPKHPGPPRYGALYLGYPLTLPAPLSRTSGRVRQTESKIMRGTIVAGPGTGEGRQPGRPAPGRTPPRTPRESETPRPQTEPASQEWCPYISYCAPDPRPRGHPLRWPLGTNRSYRGTSSQRSRTRTRRCRRRFLVNKVAQ